MELTTYLSILWRRKFLLVFTTLSAATISWLGSQWLTPVYSATAMLQIATAERGALNNIQYDLEYSDRLMNTYLVIAQERPIQQALMTRFQLTDPPTINAEIIANTELIQLEVEATDAQVASQLANALAEILIEEGESLSTTNLQNKRNHLDNLLTQLGAEITNAQRELNFVVMQSDKAGVTQSITAQTLEQQRVLYAQLLTQSKELRARQILQSSFISLLVPAVPPNRPARPNLPLNLALGIVLGLSAGFSLAFLFENLARSAPTRLSQMDPRLTPLRTAKSFTVAPYER